MTATSARAARPSAGPSTRPSTRPSTGETLRRATSSELVKLRTLRSHVWLLAVATLFTLLLGPVQSLGQLAEEPQERVADSAGAVSLALTGAQTGSLLLGVLGVLVVAGEHVPRAVRTTFMLVPRRRFVVVAKVLALLLVIVTTSLVAITGAVTASFAVQSAAGTPVGWGSPDVVRVSTAMVWYLAGWGVLGLAAGWLTRSKIGGAALLLGVMLVLAPLLGLVPGRLGELLVALVPSSAGGAMIGTHHLGGLGSPGVGFLVWTAYLVVLTALSAWVTSRRDA